MYLKAASASLPHALIQHAQTARAASRSPTAVHLSLRPRSDQRALSYVTAAFSRFDLNSHCTARMSDRRGLSNCRHSRARRVHSSVRSTISHAAAAPCSGSQLLGCLCSSLTSYASGSRHRQTNVWQCADEFHRPGCLLLRRCFHCPAGAGSSILPALARLSRRRCSWTPRWPPWPSLATSSSSSSSPSHRTRPTRWWTQRGTTSNAQWSRQRCRRFSRRPHCQSMWPLAAAAAVDG